MKKRLFIWLIGLMGLSGSVNAQESVMTDAGAYEVKGVVEVDSVNAGALYDRAMVALSEWTGSDGNSKAGLDYHDRDAATVIYKGKEYVSEKKVLLDVIKSYAEFTLKVRCKDGRAQVTVTIPSVLSVSSKTGKNQSFTIVQLLNAVDKASGKKEQRGEEYMEKLKKLGKELYGAMENRLKNGGDDDDF
jgi:hypothetical protein